MVLLLALIFLIINEKNLVYRMFIIVYIVEFI